MGIYTKNFFFVCILSAFFLNSCFADSQEKEPEGDGDEAEYRQGVGQQYLSSYPGVGLYGNGYQYLGSGGAATAGSSYGNMLRQLYRPPSFGLTDKVRNWVKSFLNRRQYVKPFYTPAVSGLSYTADDLSGKPVYVAGANYKPVAVPLRQIQKYYKPYYSGSEASQSQFAGVGGQRATAGTAVANGIPSYSAYPSSSGSSSGLGSSENAANAVYAASSASNNAALYAALANSGSPAGFYGSSGSPSSGLFGSATDNKAVFGSNTRGVQYGTSGGGSSNSYFTTGGNGQIDSVYIPSAASGSAGLYSSGGSVDSSGLYGSSGNSNSELFSSSSNGGLYGPSGSSNAELFSSASSGGYYNSNGNSGGLYSSGGSNGGVSSSALYAASLGGSNAYIPSASAESSGTYAVDSGFDAPSGYPSESSYSVSYQRPQSKSYNVGSENKSSFQPVNFGSESVSKSISTHYTPEKKA